MDPVYGGGMDGISALLGLGFWSLVVGVAAFADACRWCHPMRWRSFWMSFPYGGNGIFAGRNLPFRHRGNCGALLSLATFNSAWPMIWSIDSAQPAPFSSVCTPVGRKNGIYCTTRKLKGFLC